MPRVAGIVYGRNLIPRNSEEMGGTHMRSTRWFLIIGAVVLSLVGIWWWWGRVLKDREIARHVVESMGDEKSGGEFPG